MEGDLWQRRFLIIRKIFQSTPSAWRETPAPDRADLSIVVFQSTPSAWRETRYDSAVYKRELISIHSLRMEGDIELEETKNEN